MSDNTEEPFLAEGIKRYAQALETVQAFQTMLEDRLRKIAEAYACDLFSPKKVPIDTGATEGAWGSAIWATQEGILSPRRGSVWLELGIWWRDGEVAYYCGFVDVANKAIEFTYRRNHPRIELSKWSKKTRLFMVTSKEEVSLASEFKIILDELFESLR
jgi:hypothetical protein